MLDRRLAESPRVQRALSDLAGRPLNFDPAILETAGPDTGWYVDDYRQPLPPEASGPPTAGGSFEIAQRLMGDYAFADPTIVKAVYDPATGLANRNMVLQARFGPLRFLFGCRVGPIADETSAVDGRAVRSWGWSYATLAGHLEMGKEDFAVWKWLDDGAVEFRIHVVSRRAREGNPIVRLGVRLFGRRQQRRFGRSACARMAEMVRAELAEAELRGGRYQDGHSAS